MGKKKRRKKREKLLVHETFHFRGIREPVCGVKGGGQAKINEAVVGGGGCGGGRKNPGD